MSLHFLDQLGEADRKFHAFTQLTAAGNGRRLALAQCLYLGQQRFQAFSEQFLPERRIGARAVQVVVGDPWKSAHRKTLSHLWADLIGQETV